MKSIGQIPFERVYEFSDGTLLFLAQSLLQILNLLVHRAASVNDLLPDLQDRLVNRLFDHLIDLGLFFLSHACAPFATLSIEGVA